jgi:RNA polymerase sigma factor (sigma-70 family)
VDRWLNNAGRQPLLTPAGEVHLGALVREWQDWPGGPVEAPPAVTRRGLKARDRLVASNLRLVAMVCDRYRLPVTIAMEDALQSGTIGLCRAAEKFDPARGYRFTTYAFLWIRQAVTGEVDAMANTIRIPANVHAIMKGAKYGKCSAGQLEAAGVVWRGCISLDGPNPNIDDDSRTLADTIAASRLDVADLAQAESVAEAWRAIKEADPDGAALLQLHHADAANVTELAVLTDGTRPGTTKRLRTATQSLRLLPEVQVALAG